MKENIKPTSTFKEEEEKMYTLDDKDYLLIKAINELTGELKKMRFVYG